MVYTLEEGGKDICGKCCNSKGWDMKEETTWWGCTPKDFLDYIYSLDGRDTDKTFTEYDLQKWEFDKLYPKGKYFTKAEIKACPKLKTHKFKDFEEFIKIIK